MFCPLQLQGTYRLIAGIILGFVFGFMIIRSGMGWRRSLLNLITFKDSAFLRIFLFSVAIGIPLFHFALEYGFVCLNYRPAYFWGALTGGVISGVGIAFCRQIPVTAIASLASGRLYALWTLAGMLLAMPLSITISGWLSGNLYTWTPPLVFRERLDEYVSTTTILIWLPAVALIIALFLQFTLSEEDDS